jgi:aspartyl/glutamyl-tRNA(Asn/Gln) amidotransferase C subunit
MISKSEVEKIAKLARLELSEKEIEKMQKDLSSILDYFNILKKAPKAKAEAVAKKENVLREDKAISKDPTIADNLIKSFPNKKDRYIKVKSIL